jgi:hypothetical protein
VSADDDDADEAVLDVELALASPPVVVGGSVSPSNELQPAAEASPAGRTRSSAERRRHRFMSPPAVRREASTPKGDARAPARIRVNNVEWITS